MRYSKNENTYILGNFSSGDTVTIDVYKLSDDSKIVDGASCSEIASTGIFKYNFNQTSTEKEEYLWIMSNGSTSQEGKIVFDGYIDTLLNEINTLLNEANTLLNEISDILKATTYTITKKGNIITIYEEDNSTIWKQYNLSNGRKQI